MGTNSINITKNKPTRIHSISFSEKVAMLVGCSSRMVRYVLNNERSQKTQLAKRILKAAKIVARKEEELKKIKI